MDPITEAEEKARIQTKTQEQNKQIKQINMILLAIPAGIIVIIVSYIIYYKPFKKDNDTAKSNDDKSSQKHETFRVHITVNYLDKIIFTICVLGIILLYYNWNTIVDKFKELTQLIMFFP